VRIYDTNGFGNILDIPPKAGGKLYSSLHARLSFSTPAQQLVVNNDN
jgi:hypothetical protein